MRFSIWLKHRRGADAAQTTRRPKMNEATAMTRKTKKQILASVAKSPARPPNPRTAATIAIRKNVMAQLSIAMPFVCSVDAAGVPLTGVSPFSGAIEHDRNRAIDVPCQRCSVRTWFGRCERSPAPPKKVRAPVATIKVGAHRREVRTDVPPNQSAMAERRRGSPDQTGRRGGEPGGPRRDAAGRTTEKMAPEG
jgi:hypothetical protein